MRQRYASGTLSYDLNGLRELVKGKRLIEYAVLGLGEAGGRIAADLAAAGCTVRGLQDPARSLEGITNAASAEDAVGGADVVLSINAAAVALDVAVGVAGALRRDVVYADLNTASPELKGQLAGALPVQFADVALIGVVPATGIRTPALASGAGAERFGALLRPLGMPVDVLGPRPGQRRRREVAAQHLHEGPGGRRDRDTRRGESRRSSSTPARGPGRGNR